MASKIQLAAKADSLNGKDMEEADLCLAVFYFCFAPALSENSSM